MNDLEEYLEKYYGSDFRRENAEYIIRDYLEWKAVQRNLGEVVPCVKG